MPTIIIIVCVLFLLFIIRSCFKYPAKTRSARRIRAILILGILAVIAVCAVLEYGPRGENSFFSKPAEGEHVGQGDKQSYANGGSPDQSAENVRITVTQSTIEIGGKTFRKDDEYQGLEEYLKKQLGAGAQVVLRDDYAVSSAYHLIIGLLEEQGITYLQESVN